MGGPLRDHRATITQPPRNHRAITLQPPCNHSATTVQPPRNHHATSTQPPRKHHATTTQPPRTQPPRTACIDCNVDEPKWVPDFFGPLVLGQWTKKVGTHFCVFCAWDHQPQYAHSCGAALTNRTQPKNNIRQNTDHHINTHRNAWIGLTWRRVGATALNLDA